MSYLRNRPFLTLSYTYVPEKGQDTRIKNFGMVGRYDAIENMKILDRINAKTMQDADIILDLFESKMIKVPESDYREKEIFDKIVARYYSDIKEALADWIKRDVSNLARVQSFIEKTTAAKMNETGESNAGELEEATSKSDSN